MRTALIKIDWADAIRPEKKARRPVATRWIAAPSMLFVFGVLLFALLAITVRGLLETT